MVILCKSERSAERVMKSIADFIEGEFVKISSGSSAIIQELFYFLFIFSQVRFNPKHVKKSFEQ